MHEEALNVRYSDFGQRGFAQHSRFPVPASRLPPSAFRLPPSASRLPLLYIPAQIEFRTRQRNDPIEPRLHLRRQIPTIH